MFPASITIMNPSGSSHDFSLEVRLVNNEASPYVIADKDAEGGALHALAPADAVFQDLSFKSAGNP